MDATHTVMLAELTESRHQTWLMVGSIFLGIVGSLLLIVKRRSRLIERQRHALADKIHELSLLLDQNSQLQERVERASRLAAMESELLMHRLGADLHDGPAQLISFALLRLDAIFTSEPRQPGSAPPGSDLSSVRGALTDAINEVRYICAGLSMPRIACQPIMEAIRTVVEEHSRRTGTFISVHVSSLPIQTPHLIKVSLCRFVQEGLNNSFRHAGAKGRSVAAWSQGDEVVVEVTDEGPGMEHTVPAGPGGLGLAGLLNRIESLGGRLQIRSVLGEGTRLTATMPLVCREGRFHQ
jgi:signal transduction histidine kinase